jgi:hypothetical protein
MASNFQDEVTPCIVLTSESPRIEQPPRLKIQLKQHQLALIHRCRELEDSSLTNYVLGSLNIKTRIGIIGDVVGSGKTLSILGLIESERNVKTSIPKYYSNPHVSYIDSSNSNYSNYSNKKVYDNTNIIIVPHNIYKQWSSAIESQTNLKYIGIFNKKSYEKFKEHLEKDELVCDIILISSTKYKDVSNDLYNCAFSRVVIDEADSIKITGFLLPNNFIWYVTSTYDVLCNPYGKRKYSNSAGQISDYYNYSEGFTNYVYIRGVSSTLIKSSIVNSFCNIDSKVRKCLVIKNDDDFIRQAFSLEDYIIKLLKSNNPLIANVLGSFASQEIMNHINGGDIEGAIEKLNCKKISENFLIEAVTKDFEEKLHNKKIELEMKSKMTYSSDNAKKESLEKIKVKICDLEIKISGIKSKLNDNNLCSICYDEIENKAITMCCNTKFCIECISNWLCQKNSCPFCRATISNDTICVITDKEDIDKKKEFQLPNKITHLKNIIEKNKNVEHFKMLIFSDFDNTFNNITDFMDSKGITHRKVMGTTATINKIVNNYKLPNNNPESIQILLLNAEYCASGINLENTSDIVIYHSMNDAKTKQIIGRGQRPGRTNVLNVWKLCYENEIIN